MPEPVWWHEVATEAAQAPSTEVRSRVNLRAKLFSNSTDTKNANELSATDVNSVANGQYRSTILASKDSISFVWQVSFQQIVVKAAVFNGVYSKYPHAGNMVKAGEEVDWVLDNQKFVFTTGARGQRVFKKLPSFSGPKFEQELESVLNSSAKGVEDYERPGQGDGEAGPGGALVDGNAAQAGDEGGTDQKHREDLTTLRRLRDSGDYLIDPSSPGVQITRARNLLHEGIANIGEALADAADGAAPPDGSPSPGEGVGYNGPRESTALLQGRAALKSAESDILVAEAEKTRANTEAAKQIMDREQQSKRDAREDKREDREEQREKERQAIHKANAAREDQRDSDRRKHDAAERADRNSESKRNDERRSDEAKAQHLRDMASQDQSMAFLQVLKSLVPAVDEDTKLRNGLKKLAALVADGTLSETQGNAKKQKLQNDYLAL